MLRGVVRGVPDRRPGTVRRMFRLPVGIPADIIQRPSGLTMRKKCLAKRSRAAGRVRALAGTAGQPEPIASLRAVAYLLGEFEDSYTHAIEAIQVFERVDPATVSWYLGVLVLACLALDRKDEAKRHIRLLEARSGALADSALPTRSARTVLGFVYVEIGERERAAMPRRFMADLPARRIPGGRTPPRSRADARGCHSRSGRQARPEQRTVRQSIALPCEPPGGCRGPLCVASRFMCPRPQSPASQESGVVPTDTRPSTYPSTYPSSFVC
jgi:hypothetical protein